MKQRFQAFWSSLSLNAFAVVAAVFGIAVIFLEAILYQGGAAPVGTAVTLIVAYLCILLLTLLLRRLQMNRRNESDTEEGFSSFGGVAVLQKLPMPLLICREDGNIIWKNKSMALLADDAKQSLSGQNLSLFLPQDPELLSESSRFEKGVEMELFGRPSLCRVFSYVSKGAKLYTVVFEDRSQVAELRHHQKTVNPVIGYIRIDNLDDVLRMTGAGGHKLTAAIGEELSHFAGSVDGVLQEIEKDTFCLTFSEEGLDRICQNKFDILDRVAAIRTGERNPITVTLSIGVGQSYGTLAEKEESAQAALNYAMQDGGACAMVKGSGKDYVKYGGNTKAVQSSSKVRARSEGERLLREISLSDQVIIMGHRGADFDSFASNIGAARMAMSCGVPTFVVLNRGSYNIRRAIPGAESMPDFRDIFIDSAEAQERLTTNTLLIITDVNNPELFEAPDLERCAERVAYIDHHRKTEDFEKVPVVKYIDSNASSASELLAEMIEACLPKSALTLSEADFLLSGIMLDTKNFTVGAGPRTFGAAQFLKSIGADPMRVQEQFFSPDMAELRRQSSFESGAKVYREGIVIAVNRDPSITMAEDYIGSKAADHLLTVKNVEASFVIFRIGNAVRIKARSSGNINVQAIMAYMGGGGHFEAAAHSLDETELQDGVKRLTEAIDRYFEEVQTVPHT